MNMDKAQVEENKVEEYRMIFFRMQYNGNRKICLKANDEV